MSYKGESPVKTPLASVVYLASRKPMFQPKLLFMKLFLEHTSSVSLKNITSPERQN